MKNKPQRLMAIKKIIQSQKISSQEELLNELEKQGFSYTQATLSRDLKFMKVSKVVDNEKGYVYIFPDRTGYGANTNREGQLPVTGFKSIEFSNNLAVIKAVPGYAPSIAARIDQAEIYEILATVAGDDTILLIPREGVSRADVVHALSLIMPEIVD